MAGITTGNHPKFLWPGIAGVFGAKYDEHKTQYTDLFDKTSSSKNYEEYVQIHGFGLAPIKAEGTGVSYTDHSQGYVSRFVHIAYALGYIVTKEEIDDNLYTEVSMQRAESLAFSMRQTKENVGANVYNRAFDSNYTGGDGKELLATDHPNTTGGTFSNELTTAADLSEPALEDIVIQIRKATDDVGLKISLRPTKLIIPPDLEFVAARILKSTLRSDSANNDLNALRANGSIPQIVINQYLTDTDAWFVRTTAPKGMLCIDRTPMEFTKDNDFDTENAKAKAYERYSMGWNDPRGLFGSPGA